MKRCTKCKIPKELNEFGNNKREKDGKNYACRECERERMEVRAGKVTTESEFFQHQKLVTI